MQYNNAIYRNFDVLRNFRVQLESGSKKKEIDSTRIEF